MRTIKVMDLQEWDDLVCKTYGKPYDFQQQYGCQERGMFDISVPAVQQFGYVAESIEEYKNNPFEFDGVRFSVWLSANIEDIDNWDSFHPDIFELVNDLYDKGLLEKGEFSIDIDW